MTRKDNNHRIYGSPGFIRRTRDPNLPRPERFERTVKQAGDVVI